MPKGTLVVDPHNSYVNLWVEGCGERMQVVMLLNHLPIKKIMRHMIADRMNMSFTMNDLREFKYFLKEDIVDHVEEIYTEGIITYK